MRKNNKIIKETIRRRTVASLKRLFKMNVNGGSSSNLQAVPEGDLPSTSLIYYEHQKINAQLLNMERMKAQAIQFVNLHNHCI